MSEHELDEFLSLANALLGEGRFEEAVEKLRAGRDQAFAKGDSESEAFFSSVAGSFSRFAGTGSGST